MQQSLQLGDVPFSQRLRDFRLARGYSRDDLAQEVGVTSITLYRWETGSTRPSPLAAEKLGELGLNILEHETNLGSIPRLKETKGNRTRSTSTASHLKELARTKIGASVSLVPSPFVRNGPPDQEEFHRKLLSMQLIEHELPPGRLSLAESVDGSGTTSQHLLEKPKATAVSWNSNYGTHGWHRYVGRFPPHVIRALLNYFGANSNTVVFDPFAGSGTTAVECRLLGIPFVGVEICPLSCLMTRTKSAFPETPEILIETAAGFSKFYRQKSSEFLRSRNPGDVGIDEILEREGNLIPTFANIRKWFTAEALLGTSIAVEYGMSLDGFERDAVLLALSSKMRSIGNVDVDVVRAEYSKKPRAKVDVEKLVTERLKKMSSDIARSISSHAGLIGSPSSIKLFEGSVLDVDLPSASIDHVITSPPYGVEALSYLRTHLLSYRSLVAYLHHDPYETRDKTIGSEYMPKGPVQLDHAAEHASPACRAFFAAAHGEVDTKYQARRSGMIQFFDDILIVTQRLSNWVKDDGMVAFIVGNKRLGDDVIPTDAIVRELFVVSEFSFVEAIRHKLKTNNSNSQVPWQERVIQEESILVFRRNRRGQ